MARSTTSDPGRSARGGMPAPRCAVVGYDGTDEARAALLWALEHVDPEGRVIAVGVVGQEPAPVPGGDAVARVGQLMTGYDPGLWQGWDADVGALAGEVELVVEHGRPSSVLVRIAGERDADVIVVGHRRHRLGAPSVLRDLLAAADRPVVIVP
jgi:nucleotide-binding universal stress UspA family protein